LNQTIRGFAQIDAIVVVNKLEIVVNKQKRVLKNAEPVSREASPVFMGN
jgi:hypothetical protein